MAVTKIRAFRTQKGITQKQLAELVGTSQQQIQRMETGNQSVRFDLAVKICSALKQPMELVFPETKKALDKLEKKHGNRSKLDDEQFADDMKQANVDMDPAIWSFKYRLRGGVNGVVPLSGIEKDRLFGAVQRCNYRDTFLVFDSEETRILLNLDHLTFCQFLFDPPNIVQPDREEDNNVKVYMADSSEPLLFGVDEDMWDRDDEEEMGQFGHLIFMAEHSTGEDNDVLHFHDFDGEEAFFRAKDIAMMQIPLWVIEPHLLDAKYEDNDQASSKGNA